MASRELQGWHPDPFGLHEKRYFSVGRPTKLVRDGRIEAYDEPPENWSAASAVSGAQAVAAGSEQAAAQHTDVPAASLQAVAAGTPAMTAGAADQAGPTRVLPAVNPGWAARPGAAAPPPHARPRGRRIEYAFVAAGAVVAVLVFVALGGGTAKPGLAPAAFVTKAAQRTMAQRTADVTVSGTVQAAGEKLAMGGSGKVDFTTGVMSVNVGASTSDGSLTETELLVGSDVYLQVSVDGHSQALSGGRHWLEIPFADSGGRNLTTGSPAASLALLAQSGARVTSLGSRNMGGRTCNGYVVTPSEQAMVAGAKQALLKLGFSAAEADAAVQVVRSSAPPTITAWFDASTQLACQISVNMDVGGQSSVSETVQMVMTFTHYGTAVNVTAPAASDTAMLSQLLHASQP